MSARLLDRYGEAFARALSVFVREIAKEKVRSQDPDRSRGEELLRTLHSRVATNDRLERAGRLKTVRFDAQSVRRAIADRVRARLRKQNMTQAQLAQLLGIAPANISRLLKHPEKSKVETWQRIASALKLDLGELFRPPAA